MSVADVDGDGLIDYNEFVASTMHLSKLEKEEVRGRGGLSSLNDAVTVYEFS
jgi:hypothetical protein